MRKKRKRQIYVKTSLPFDRQFRGVDGHKTLEQFIQFKSDQAFIPT